MTANAIINNETKTGNSWGDLFSQVFDSKQYKKIESRQLVGLYNCVYVKNILYPHITNPMIASNGVGKFGLGNKVKKT